MKCRKLLFWVLLSFFVLTSMSMVGLADKYREVQASDILKQIENGEDVYLENCRIVGEFNLSKIELEKIPNPKYSQLLESGIDEKKLEYDGINEHLKVVESNIIIVNSIFDNNLDFSNLLFKKSLNAIGVKCSPYSNFRGTIFGYSTSFRGTIFGDYTSFYEATFGDRTSFDVATFGDYTSFQATTFGDYTSFQATTFGDYTSYWGATFGNFTLFNGVTFDNSTTFLKATFGNDVYFNGATFGNDTYFLMTTFGDFTDFNGVTFGDNTNFWWDIFGDDVSFYKATFGDNASFSESTFGGSAKFVEANFSNTSYFNRTHFAETVDFSDTKFKKILLSGTDYKEMRVRWNSLEDSLIFDGLTYVQLIRNFRNLEQFDDADAAYFQYRKFCQAENPWISFPEKSPWISFPKVGDIFMWLTCGYGVKPSYTVGSSILVILLFSAIYLWEDLCSIGLKKYFGRRFLDFSSIISRLRISRGKNILNLSSWIFYLRALFHWRSWDACYFSIASFTNSSYNDWKPGRYGRKLAVFEGFVGNLLIALFIVALVNVLIRP